MAPPAAAPWRIARMPPPPWSNYKTCRSNMYTLLRRADDGDVGGHQDADCHDSTCTLCRLFQWSDVPDFIAAEVLKQLGWERKASTVFRMVCQGWLRAHDGCLMTVTANALPCINAEWTRFKGVRTLRAHLNPPVTVTDDRLAALSTGLPALTSLVLTGIMHVTSAGVWSSALAKLPSLTMLDIFAPCVVLHEDDCLGCLQLPPGLTSLRSLTLRGGKAVICDTALESLAPLTSLTELTVRGCCIRDVTDSGLASLTSLTGLTSLSLTGGAGWQVTETGLKAALGPLTALTRIESSAGALDGAHQAGLKAALAPLTALTRIESSAHAPGPRLYDCDLDCTIVCRLNTGDLPVMNDSVLESLPQGLTHTLTHLDLDRCYSVSDAAAELLNKGLMDNSHLGQFFGAHKYLGGKFNSPVVEWLNKGLMVVWSPNRGGAPGPHLPGPGAPGTGIVQASGRRLRV
eukprot:1175482-Prorocentrum_minimum.AAC.1